MRRDLLVVTMVLGAVALTGCSGGTGGTGSPAASTTTETVTATATATVTATPPPAERSWDDPISSFDAWSLCWGATYGLYSDTSTVYPYSDDAPGGTTVTDLGDGTYQVRVPFASSDGTGFGAETVCVAGGTVGTPAIVSIGAHDFG